MSEACHPQHKIKKRSFFSVLSFELCLQIRVCGGRGEMIIVAISHKFIERNYFWPLVQEFAHPHLYVPGPAINFASPTSKSILSPKSLEILILSSDSFNLQLKSHHLGKMSQVGKGKHFFKAPRPVSESRGSVKYLNFKVLTRCEVGGDGIPVVYWESIVRCHRSCIYVSELGPDWHSGASVNCIFNSPSFCTSPPHTTVIGT